MEFSIRQMQVFRTAAKFLNFTRAGKELYLSQPAVSMQIRQLEEEVGLPLFEKHGKKMSLSEAGREMLRSFDCVFNELESLEETLAGFKGLNRGTIHIGVASTVNYFAPWLLAAFNRRYPDIKIQVEAINRKELIAMSETNEKDLLLMGKPPEGGQFSAEPFLDNSLVIIAPVGHHLAGEDKISMERIAEETFVMREPGSGTRAAMEQAFTDAGHKVKAGFQMTRNEAIKQSVMAGLGLSVVPLLSVEMEIGAGRLVVLPVEGFPLSRHWYIVHRSDRRLSPSANAFKEFVLQEEILDLTEKPRSPS